MQAVTLYDKLGGKKGISDIIDGLYDYILEDQQIGHHFNNTDVFSLADSFKLFFSRAFGGIVEYQELDLKQAHRNMKLTQKDFDRFWVDFKQSMVDLKIQNQLIQEVKVVCYSYQGDIVTV